MSDTISLAFSPSVSHSWHRAYVAYIVNKRIHYRGFTALQYIRTMNKCFWCTLFIYFESYFEKKEKKESVYKLMHGKMYNMNIHNDNNDN